MRSLVEDAMSDILENGTNEEKTKALLGLKAAMHVMPHVLVESFFEETRMVSTRSMGLEFDPRTF